MSELRSRARGAAVRLRASTGTAERLRRLEEEVQENRRLNRRLAELTDLVTELLCRCRAATTPRWRRCSSATARSSRAVAGERRLTRH